MYPRIIIDLKKLEHNAKTIVKKLHEASIDKSFVVTKMFAGDLRLAKVYENTGFSYLADSRIANLKKFRSIEMPKVLLRLPMKSEIREVVKYTQMSLNSELDTIILLNKEAAEQNKNHQVLLMFDLGDLREGIWFEDDYLTIVKEVLQLSHIKLIGIGTNLTCYGGVIPTTHNLNQLVEIKNNIEHTFHITLELISGGNTSSMYLVDNKSIPSGINNLRLGEAVVLGKETAFGQDILDLYQDVFTVQAKVIELKTKPSYPIGKIGLDSFGETPVLEDKGLMKRAILAIGKQDVLPNNLTPIDPFISIIGGSSDHLIVDVAKSKVKLNSTISFRVNYAGLLQAMTSKYVMKIYQK